MLIDEPEIFRCYPPSNAYGTPHWLQAVKAEFPGVHRWGKVILGKQENQKSGKENRGESNASTGDRTSIFVSSSQMSPTTPQPRVQLRVVKLSGAGESHPRALLKPDVNLSIHPAPIVQP